MYASSKSLGWKLMRTSTKISYCVVPEQTSLIACEIATWVKVQNLQNPELLKFKL